MVDSFQAHAKDYKLKLWKLLPRNYNLIFSFLLQFGFHFFRFAKDSVGRSHTDSRIKLWIHTASLKTSNIPFAWFLVLGSNRQARRR